MNKVRHRKLEVFLDTEIGNWLWDSLRVKLVYREKVVFDLIDNYDIQQDDLKLINPETNEFTSVVKHIIVTGYCTIDKINYIFIDVVSQYSHRKLLELVHEDDNLMYIIQKDQSGYLYDTLSINSDHRIIGGYIMNYKTGEVVTELSKQEVENIYKGDLNV